MKGGDIGKGFGKQWWDFTDPSSHKMSQSDNWVYIKIFLLIIFRYAKALPQDANGWISDAWRGIWVEVAKLDGPYLLTSDPRPPLPLFSWEWPHRETHPLAHSTTRRPIYYSSLILRRLQWDSSNSTWHQLVMTEVIFKTWRKFNLLLFVIILIWRQLKTCCTNLVKGL